MTIESEHEREDNGSYRHPWRERAEALQRRVAELEAELSLWKERFDFLETALHKDRAGGSEARAQRDGAPSRIDMERASKMIGDLDREVAALRAESCRFYSADGSYEVFDPEAVKAKRIAAAAEITALRAKLSAVEAERDDHWRAIESGAAEFAAIREDRDRQHNRWLTALDKVERLRADLRDESAELAELTAIRSAYIHANPREDCLPSHRFRVVMPSGISRWFGDYQEAEACQFEAVEDVIRARGHDEKGVA